VAVRVDDATPYTLFGAVLTGEQVGVACGHEPSQVDSLRRIRLPLV
jgi:hypothetical protein